MNNDLPYVGQELDIFAHARNWKRYWSSSVRPFLRGDVLEVGAGIGVNTPFLDPQKARSWTCLEPDAGLAQRATVALASDPMTRNCHVLTGTTESLAQERQFDAVLYIDVLEHIDRDKEELARAANLLRQGGTLIVLSPAHQWLYTAFDQSIGHVRRYNRTSLLSCGPPTCSLKRLWYLDSIGTLASCANRLFLRQAMPGLQQILFWDNYLVPASTIADYLFFHRLGKSILAVWTRNH